MMQWHDGEGPNELAEQLRQQRDNLRDVDGDLDRDALSDVLSKAADWTETAYLGECRLATPFEEIYAVGTREGLVYRCRHTPYHSFGAPL